MRLYIVRHGQTDWNREQKFQGTVDRSLTEKGREAAILLGKKLESENILFDIIYSSPLNRAFETACLIRGRQNIQIVRDERLIEISFGDLEGMKYDDWMNSCEGRIYFFKEPGKYVPPSNGETFQSVMERTGRFLKQVIEPSDAERILVVCHGALLAGLTSVLEGRSVEEYWGDGLAGNCECLIYEYDGSSWKKEPGGAL